VITPIGAEGQAGPEEGPVAAWVAVGLEVCRVCKG